MGDVGRTPRLGLLNVQPQQAGNAHHLAHSTSESLATHLTYVYPVKSVVSSTRCLCCVSFVHQYDI